MGKYQKNKGYRAEHELVNKFAKRGLDAKRVPLSGSTDFAKGDVIVNGMTIEVKWRGNGFKSLYTWLENKDALAIKADRKDFLIVMPLDTFVELLIGGKKRG